MDWIGFTRAKPKDEDYSILPRLRPRPRTLASRSKPRTSKDFHAVLKDTSRSLPRSKTNIRGFLLFFTKDCTMCIVVWHEGVPLPCCVLIDKS